MMALCVCVCKNTLENLGATRNAKMLEVFLPNRTYSVCPYSFICNGGKRILHTHLEEAIIIGFGILATPENHICEIAILCDYCPEWQVPFITHANLID